MKRGKEEEEDGRISSSSSVLEYWTLEYRRTHKSRERKTISTAHFFGQIMISSRLFYGQSQRLRDRSQGANPVWPYLGEKRRKRKREEEEGGRGGV